jgi:hypothetical protein
MLFSFCKLLLYFVAFSLERDKRRALARNHGFVSVYFWLGTDSRAWFKRLVQVALVATTYFGVL